RGESLVIAAQALAECYSVLTRSPAPLRVPAGQAMAMLDQSFVQNGEVVALDGSDYVALLGSLPARGVTGGLVYDAIIAACALKGNAEVFLTFNERHAQQVVDGSIEVTVPRANGAGAS